jgi:hypothetical protein
MVNVAYEASKNLFALAALPLELMGCIPPHSNVKINMLVAPNSENYDITIRFDSSTSILCKSLDTWNAFSWPEHETLLSKVLESVDRETNPKKPGSRYLFQPPVNRTPLM